MADGGIMLGANRYGHPTNAPASSQTRDRLGWSATEVAQARSVTEGSSLSSDSLPRTPRRRRAVFHVEQGQHPNAALADLQEATGATSDIGADREAIVGLLWVARREWAGHASVACPRWAALQGFVSQGAGNRVGLRSANRAANVRATTWRPAAFR